MSVFCARGGASNGGGASFCCVEETIAAIVDGHCDGGSSGINREADGVVAIGTVVVGVAGRIGEGATGHRDQAICGAVVGGSEGGGIGGRGMSGPVGEGASGDRDVGLEEVCGGLRECEVEGG